MKNHLFLPLLIMVSLLLASCTTVHAPEESKTGVKQAEYIKISAEEAKAIIGSEEVIILDVRTAEEFEEIRIESAVLIPDTEIKRLAEDLLPDKEAMILVYCRTGRRSEIASRALIHLGYKNVYDFGGIVDWPFETISGK